MSSPPDTTTAADFGTQITQAPRMSDTVAEAMLATILRRGLRPGHQLPSERELGEQYGVSRTVVREAVRALTARGVVNARAGRGLTVAQVDPRVVSTSMKLYLHGHGMIPYDKVHEVRSTLEVQIAGYAAERATDEEVEELRETCELLHNRRDDVEQLSAFDVEFHRTLARLTHNEIYLIMLDSIGDVMLDVRRATMRNLSDPTKAYREHKRVVNAVAAHDAEAARDAMSRHIRASRRDWDKVAAEIAARRDA